jgi:hypothetical protein
MAFLLIITLVLIECRYKDNDKLNLYSAKKRLEKTWLLKEASVDDFNVIEYSPSLLNEELFFENVTNKSLYLGAGERHIAYRYIFQNKKTEIYYSDESGNWSLKITKLTNKELWLEGDGVGNMAGASKQNKVKLKYIAK